MIRILLAEDQAMVRGAIAALLELEDDLAVVAQVGRGDEVVAAAVESRPDVALLDIEMPGMDGLAAARALHETLPSCTTLILTTFGRPTRETVCSCEVRLEPTLSQSLHLMNGDTVASKISQGNLIGKLLAEKKPPAFVIENLYVRCLSRPPTPAEMQKLLAAVEASPNKQQALEDVFWAVLNSREFMFNH